MGAWRSILAVLGEGARSASVLRMAASIATRMGAELEALQASKQPSVGAFLAPEGARVAQQWARERAQQRRVQMQAVVRQVESECGLPIPFGFVAGDPLDHTLGRACGADSWWSGSPIPTTRAPCLPPSSSVCCSVPVVTPGPGNWCLAGSRAR